MIIVTTGENQLEVNVSAVARRISTYHSVSLTTAQCTILREGEHGMAQATAAIDLSGVRFRARRHNAVAFGLQSRYG